MKMMTISELRRILSRMPADGTWMGSIYVYTSEGQAVAAVYPDERKLVNNPDEAR